MVNMEEIINNIHQYNHVPITYAGSKITENLYYNGKIHIKFYELKHNILGTPYEELVEDRTISNLIVNDGKASILKYLGNISGGGYFASIGVGDSASVADASNQDLQASTNKLWQTIDDRVFNSNTLYVSTSFGYSVANWTWNELGLCDSQGTGPTYQPSSGAKLIARRVDGTPLVKTTSIRAIVEWQITV